MRRPLAVVASVALALVVLAACGDTACAAPYTPAPRPYTPPPRPHTPPRATPTPRAPARPAAPAAPRVPASKAPPPSSVKHVPRPPAGTNLGDPNNAQNPLNRWNPASPFYWWFWHDAASKECQ